MNTASMLMIRTEILNGNQHKSETMAAAVDLRTRILVRPLLDRSMKRESTWHPPMGASQDRANSYTERMRRRWPDLGSFPALEPYSMTIADGRALRKDQHIRLIRSTRFLIFSQP